jgi:hypothetical protein
LTVPVGAGAPAGVVIVAVSVNVPVSGIVGLETAVAIVGTACSTVVSSVPMP